MIHTQAPIRIGILGCAEVAKYALIPPVKEVSGLTVSAVAGREVVRARTYAIEQGIPTVYPDYQALIESAEVDLVYIALPNSLHCEWSIRALQSGKAVLCEKPLAANAREAQRMADAAALTARPLIEAFHYRHHPLMRRVRALVTSGGIGRLRSVEARWLIPSALVADGNIRLSYGLAGGSLMDPGCYCVNLLRYIVGEEPVVVEARAQCVAPEVDVRMHSRLRFPGGCEGIIESSLVHSGKAPTDMDMWLAVVGDQGRLTVRNPFMPQMGHELSIDSGDGFTSEQCDTTSTYVHQVRNVLAVMRGQEISATPASDAVANMRVIDAIYRAAGMTPRGAAPEKSLACDS
jgi:predicted dehydrogenase